MTALRLSYQQALVEEVVLRAIAGHADERRFRRQRDALYLLPLEQRDAAFGEFNAQWFTQLGLARPFDVALAELPLLAESCGRGVVRRAAIKREEGADLLVASDTAGPAGRTLLICLCTSTFDDAESLLALLRAELLHVADMVDPAFGYQPTLPRSDAGPAYEHVVRERYRVLWQVSVTGRLVRLGVARPQAEAAAAAAFHAAFPMLDPEEAEQTFSRFFSGASVMHSDIASCAAAPRAERAAECLRPGGRCPLCRFPTYTPEAAPAAFPAALVQRILGDFPTWRPSDGICSQCADLYRSRPLSATAAALLPGA